MGAPEGLQGKPFQSGAQFGSAWGGRLVLQREAECRNALSAGVPIAAYEQAIEASHVFNLLQARGVISVQERASYMGRVRDLARSSCEAYAQKMTPEWQAKYPGWSLV